jgi:hypothetical protein
MTDESGETYLVPNFILPAARFSAAVEDKKAGIDLSQAPGVSHFSFTIPNAAVCRKFPALLAAHLRHRHVCGFNCG